MPAPEMRYFSSCYFPYSHVIIICSISHTHLCQSGMDRKYQLKWTRACHCLGRFSHVVHHVLAWSSIVIKWWSRRRTHHCTHCWSSAPAISYFSTFFFFCFHNLNHIFTSVFVKQCVERASIDGVGWSQEACLPLLGTVLSSCSSWSGAIKHQVKWWCQLRRWGSFLICYFA